MNTRPIVRRFLMGLAVAIVLALLLSRRARSVAVIAVGSGVVFAAVPLVLSRSELRRVLGQSLRRLPRRS